MMKLLILLFFIYSCSQGGESKPVTGPVIQKDPLEEEMSGLYQALLAPVNKKISGHLNGALTLVKEDDEFIADVRFSGGPPSVLHTQHIHYGERCPNGQDDKNGDEFIDGEEAMDATKGIIIPLDDDISSQRMGGGIYPAADEFGYYYYTKATSFKKLLEDLHEEDINEQDDFLKMTPTKKLQLLNKVVVIYGVPETFSLPGTVSGRGRLTAHQAIPVACGVIRRLTKAPGVIDNDEPGIPLPEGGAIGGSAGINDGADFNQKPPTEGNPNNYGED